MVDRSVADVILDYASSEVKRWGGTEPTLTHGAWVLSRSWDKEFDEVFGVGARERLAELLAVRRFRGTRNGLVTILAEAPDRRAVLEELHAQLLPDLTAALVEPASEPPADGTDDAPAPQRQAGKPGAVPWPLAERTVRVLQLVEPSSQWQLRASEAADVAAHLLRLQPVIPALVGEHGVGRTATLGAVAALLAGLPDPLALWRLAPDTVVANPAATLRMVLSDISAPTVVAIDDFDVLAELAGENPDRDFVDLVEDARFHPHARLVVVLNRRYASRVGICSPALQDCLRSVPLQELPPEQLDAIVNTAGAELAARRGLELDPGTVAAALAPAIAADGAVHPGLAIARLDLACARAYLAKAKVVGVAHLGTSAQAPIRAASEGLAMALARTVKGQPEAIARVARRLTLTRANLDLRPDRPNGVFLFVGPTGVGKTQLAKEIAVAEYGGPDRLIRLDMSEYAHDWAISRIAGPAPGYVGSTEPESWLTTKVSLMPGCVVLLDEIEKAHPRVWNLFLQVFDAGRLTDSRGLTADFSQTVIVMTSNLGVQEARRSAVGFGSSEDRDVARDRLLAVVRDRMAPELLNRMDEVIVFDALGMAAIEEIAESELVTVRSRLAAAGWVIQWTPEVPIWLASTGYEPSYGARHLQRNIEHEFLTLLATAPSRTLRGQVVDDRLTVTPV